MPQINKTKEMFDSAFASLLALIDNIVDGILELETNHTERVSAQLTRSIFKMRIPFSEKAARLEDEFNKIQDPQTKKKFMLKLEELKNKHMEAEKGLNEIEKLIKHTKLPNKKQMLNLIKESKYSLSDPYRVQVSRSVYTQFVAYMNERRNNGLFEQDGILSDSFVQALAGSDGSYYIFTTNEFKDYVDKLLLAAAVSCAKKTNPTKEDLQMEIITRYGKRDGVGTNKAATFTFSGLSAEFAEKVVREGLKKGTVFAKEQVGDGKYNVICSASGDVNEQNKRYKKAVVSIASAAMAMSGKNADVETKRMRHYINEDNKIRNAIDQLTNGTVEEGYFVTLNTEEGLVTPKEVVEYNSDRFTLTTANGRQQTIYADSRDNSSMIASLKQCVYTGTGDKVYVSADDMENIMNKTHEFDFIADCSSKLEAMTKIDEKLAEVIQEYDEARHDPQRKSMAAGLRSEKNNLLHMQNMLSRTKEFPLSEFDVSRAILGAQLQERKFYAFHDISLEGVIRAEAKCTNFGISKAMQNMSFLNQMELNSEGHSPQIGNEDIRDVIKSIDVDAFIENEFKRAEPNIEGKDQTGTLTVSDVKREASFLRGDENVEGFDAHRSEAIRLIDSINIQMDRVYAPPVLENSEVDRTPSEKSEMKEAAYISKADSMFKPQEKQEDLFADKETSKSPQRIEQKTR